MVMDKQTAKEHRNRLRDTFDLGMKYYLSICKYRKDNYGLELLVQSEQLQIGDSIEFHPVFDTRIPGKMERILAIICKRK